MEFKNQYLNYDEYKELGGTLDEMPFNLFELEARTNIDKITQSRLKEIKKIPDEVKICVYNLIKSMAFDGNYKDSNTTERKAFINQTIFSQLSTIIVNDTPLTYRGIK